MSLFATTSSDKLWVGEALGQKIVKPGALLEVESIQSVRDGRGYLITACSQGTMIFDYLWKNSSGGKVLTTCFADPSILAGQKMTVTAQDKVRNAQLDTSEKQGRVWGVKTDADGLTVLTWVDPATSTGKGTDKAKSVPPTSLDTSQAT